MTWLRELLDPMVLRNLQAQFVIGLLVCAAAFLLAGLFYVADAAARARRESKRR